jgi:soluble lytic murein transglycosylase-like protein
MNPNAISKTGDGGILQLNNRFYKFHNPKWVFNPEINLYIAIRTLKNLKQKCKHKNLNTYIVCYNLGIAGGSKIKNPFNQAYYKKSNLIWRK